MLDGIGDLSIVRADSGANPNHTAHFCTSCQMHTQRWQAIKKKTQMELYRPENRMWMKKIGNIIPVWVWSTNRKYENAYQMHKFCSISSHNTQFTRPTKWWEIINNRGQFQIKIDVLFSSDIPYYFRKVMQQFTKTHKNTCSEMMVVFFSLSQKHNSSFIYEVIPSISVDINVSGHIWNVNSCTAIISIAVPYNLFHTLTLYRDRNDVKCEHECQECNHTWCIYNHNRNVSLLRALHLNRCNVFVHAFWRFTQFLYSPFWNSATMKTTFNTGILSIFIRWNFLVRLSAL